MAIFGKPPIDSLAIADEIISTVRRQKEDDRRHWNKTVRDVLRRRADRKRYLVHPDPKEQLREWLLDVVWFTREEGTIHLAAEVELGNKAEVLYDFQKLLCVKAPLKVMIVYAEKKSFVKSLEEYMDAFDHHVKGERYLLVEFAPGRADRAYLYSAPSDGRLSKVKFSELSVGRAAAA